MVQIESNQSNATFELAKKHAGTSHGYSLLALMMLDKSNKEIHVTVTLSSMDELQDAADQMFGVWSKCVLNRVHFRSCTVEGQYVDQYEGLPMISQSEIPVQSDSFGLDYKLVCDVKMTYDSRVYSFVRRVENKPRLLTMLVSSS